MSGITPDYQLRYLRDLCQTRRRGVVTPVQEEREHHGGVLRPQFVGVRRRHAVDTLRADDPVEHRLGATRLRHPGNPRLAGDAPGG